MNNSVYNKTMENVINRINFKLVSSEAEALGCRNQKQKFTMFNDNLVGVHLLKNEVKLNKPIFIGQYQINLNLSCKTFIIILCKRIYHARNLKGVKSSVVKKDIKLENYKEALFYGKDMKVKMNAFRSYSHQIYTEQITKKALPRNNDKCYILDYQVHTRPFGHYLNN